MDRPLVNVSTWLRTALLLGVVGVATMTVLASFEGLDLTRLGLIFLVSWALCVSLLTIGRTGGVYRPSSAYLVLFGLFHGGLLISIALRGPDAFATYDSLWIYGGYTAQATRLVILGMAVFTLAATLTSDEPRERARPTSGWATQRPALAVVGLGVQVIGLVIFVMAVDRAGGVDVLSGGYSAYLEANQSDGALGYGTFLAGVGPVLAIVAGGRPRVVAWVLFIGYALLAFLVGTRGSVLFPLLALLVVEVRLGRKPHWLLSVGGALGLLVLIGLVRQTRLGGLSAASSLASPMDAVAEMGYSMRPTVVTLDWHSAGEPYRLGSTLIAVPLRFVENLTGWHGGVPAYDDRLFNVEVMARVGPIGGSPIAEGNHNFGTIGVVLLMAAIGVALGMLQRAPRTPTGHALVGIVLLPLLIQVRNSFALVFVQLMIGLFLLGVVHVWSARGTFALMRNRNFRTSPAWFDKRARLGSR